jgi:hypothetical protein
MPTLATTATVAAERSGEIPTIASDLVAADSSPLDLAAMEVHLALGGRPTEQPGEDVLDAVRVAISNVRSRRASKISTDEDAHRYRTMTHPDDYCHPAWCLARVEIDEQTGLPWHNTGVHRRAVRSVEAKWGVLLQIGIGVADDFELDLDNPFVHVWQTDLDDNPDCVEELHLTADEADRLGDFLKAAALELRTTKSRIAATGAAVATPDQPQQVRGGGDGAANDQRSARTVSVGHRHRRQPPVRLRHGHRRRLTPGGRKFSPSGWPMASLRCTRSPTRRISVRGTSRGKNIG